MSAIPWQAGTIVKVSANLENALGKLLGAWGVPAPGPAEAAIAAILAEAGRIGIADADVSVRWGRATVTADGPSCARLSWHREQLARVASDASDGVVTDVRVTTRRARPGTNERHT